MNQAGQPRAVAGAQGERPAPPGCPRSGQTVAPPRRVRPGRECLLPVRALPPPADRPEGTPPTTISTTTTATATTALGGDAAGAVPVDAQTAGLCYVRVSQALVRTEGRGGEGEAVGGILDHLLPSFFMARR